MWVYGQRDPAEFRFEMLQSNRSFWSFLTESRTQQVYDNPPKVFVDSMYDLAIHVSAFPPHTPITKVWNKDLSHYDSTCDDQDDRHHVTYSEVPISAYEYGSVTAWRTILDPG